MIECKNCGLPALPPVLFWEGIFNARLPCLCGCLERVGERARDAQSQALDFDFYAELRAADDGMPEKQNRFFEIAAAAPQPRKVIPRSENLRAGDFDKWLAAQDKKRLAAAAANTDAVVVRKAFRKLQLKKAFQTGRGKLFVPAKSRVEWYNENPYMNSRTTLAKIL